MQTTLERETVEHEFELPNFITGFHLAIPLPDSLLFQWEFFKNSIVANLKPSLYDKTDGHMPHITLKYFGNISIKEVDKIDVFMMDNASLIRGQTIQIDSLEIIGKSNNYRALVGKVICSEGIWELRKRLDNQFPIKDELPFVPHLTLLELPTQDLFVHAQEVIKNSSHFRNEPIEVDFTYSAVKRDDPWLGVFLRL